MRGVVALLLAVCAVARGQSGDGETTDIPGDIIIACPLEETPDSLVTILRSPNDCSKFYKCDHGLPVEKSCPKGLLFNDNLKVCDWPRNVDCGASKPTKEPATVTPATAPTATLQPPIQPTLRPTRRPTRGPTVPPTTAAPAVSCPPNDPQYGQAVILPNPDDPHSFYICSWGVPYLQRCSSILVFNPKSKVCDWPHNAGGGESKPTREPATRPPRPTREPATQPPEPTEEPATQPPEPTEEPATRPPKPTREPATRPPRPTREPVTRPPKPTREPETQPPELTEEPATFPPKPTKPPTTTTEKPVAPAVSCPPNDPQYGQAVILPNPEDPHSFYICSWGVPYLQKCSSILVFDPKSKVCVWP